MAFISKKILVIEDENILSNTLKLKLPQLKYEVIVAYKSETALNYLMFNSFKLVILNLIKNSENGFNILKHIKENGVEVPIYFVFNEYDKNYIGKVKSQGISEYIIRSEDFLSQILAYIEKHVK